MINSHGQIEGKFLSKIQSLMLHALGFVTGDPTIKINYPFSFHPGVQVTVTEPGDSKWVYMMLPITAGSLITNIKISHYRVGIQCRVSLVRLVEQKEPIAAKIIYDDEVSKNIPSAYTINSDCRVIVNQSILLKICMEFNNTDDMIEFGSVVVSYIPDYKTRTEEQKKKVRRVKKQKLELTNFDNNNGSSVKKQRPQLLKLFFRNKKKKQLQT